MILEAIFSLINLVLKGIFALIPDMSGITLPTGLVEWFINILNMTAYFLPLIDFLAMMGIWLIVTNFQIIWKIIQRVWDALPFT
jgi:hypothetical protein